MAAQAQLAQGMAGWAIHVGSDLCCVYHALMTAKNMPSANKSKNGGARRSCTERGS